MYENLKGKSISFEGGEGAGKGTLIRNILNELGKTNLDILSTREPGGVKISEQIREVIVDKNNTEMCYETEALLYSAARAQLIKEVITPAIENNKTIILDRFVDSSYVYQGVARGLGIEKVVSINDFATKGWYPDKTIILDIDPELGLKRIFSNDRETNRLDLESIEFHKKIREGYHEVAKMFPDRIVIIDASKTEKEVLENVLKVLREI